MFGSCGCEIDVVFYIRQRLYKISQKADIEILRDKNFISKNNKDIARNISLPYNIAEALP